MRVATKVGLAESQIVDYSEDRYELRSFEALFRVTRPVAEVSMGVCSEGSELIKAAAAAQSSAMTASINDLAVLFRFLFRSSRVLGACPGGG